MFIDIGGIARMQEKWIVRTQFKRIREIVFSDRDVYYYSGQTLLDYLSQKLVTI